MYKSSAEVATLYHVNIATIWRWVREGKIKPVKIGKRYLFSEEALAEFEKREVK